MASTPRALKSRASSIDAYASHPPLTQSVPVIREMGARSSGQAERIKTKPYAIFKTNSVIISSIIGDRKIELVEQKSLRRVDFNNLVKGQSGPRCGIPRAYFTPLMSARVISSGMCQPSA